MGSQDSLLSTIRHQNHTWEDGKQTENNRLLELRRKLQHFLCTPFGCLITVYVLNVIAWGGMDFLLICNFVPAMCHPTCEDPHSPRLEWIEIDSQILVALLCVPAFALAPLRYRDLYHLLRYRLCRNRGCLRKLAGYNKDWFRVYGDFEAELDLEDAGATREITEDYCSGPVAVAPLHLSTSLWKLDFVVWCKALNTAFQATLAGFMWGYNRLDRPPWSSTISMLFSFSCIAMAKITVFSEDRRVRALEAPETIRLWTIQR